MSLKQIKQITTNSIKQPLITGFHMNQDRDLQTLQWLLHFLLRHARLNNNNSNSLMGLCVTLTAMLLGFFAYLGFQNPSQHSKADEKLPEISIQNNSNATGGKATDEATNQSIHLNHLPMTTQDMEPGS